LDNDNFVNVFRQM